MSDKNDSVLVPLASLPKIESIEEPRAVLGAILIPCDLIFEIEGPQLVQQMPGVWLFTQKLEFESDLISADTYLAAQDNISRAVKTFMPRDGFSVMGLSCTSMSFTLGPEVLDKHLCAGDPKVKTTDMARGQLAALQALGASKVVLVTPYIEELSAANVRMLAAGGIEVVRRATMGLTKDVETSRVSPQCISDWAAAAACDCDEADAVVIGCSAFRACGPDFIDSVEKRLNKPVVTSTQAFLWSMLRTAGIKDQISGYGKLFRDH